MIAILNSKRDNLICNPRQVELGYSTNYAVYFKVDGQVFMTTYISNKEDFERVKQQYQDIFEEYLKLFLSDKKQYIFDLSNFVKRFDCS